MKEKFTHSMTLFRRFEKAIKEHTAIFIAIALFFMFPYLIRLLDPTAGTYDAGVLQNTIITIVQYVIFAWAVWQSLNALWGDIGTYFKTKFSTEFQEITAWQRIKVSLSIYFFLFLILAILSRVY